MLIAIMILLSFLNKGALNVASILGGIGFGAFIDELGKFITRDNNYFFQPTVALIYIIFVLLYLISRFISRYRIVSQKEYLINAIEMFKDSAINDFDIEEEKQAKEYLEKSDKNNPAVGALKDLLVKIEKTPVPRPGIATRFRTMLRGWYYRVARSGFVLNAIIIFLAIQSARTFFQSVYLFIVKPTLPFYEWGQLYSSVLAGFFVAIGIMALRSSRIEAYRFLRIAMLITILLTDFFALMRFSWYELLGLAANLSMLVVINYAMAMESVKKRVLQK